MRARELKLLMALASSGKSLSRPMRARELKPQAQGSDNTATRVAPHAGA